LVVAVVLVESETKVGLVALVVETQNLLVVEAVELLIKVTLVEHLVALTLAVAVLAVALVEAAELEQTMVLRVRLVFQTT
jgi:hypothetical protein